MKDYGITIIINSYFNSNLISFTLNQFVTANIKDIKFIVIHKDQEYACEHYKQVFSNKLTEIKAKNENESILLNNALNHVQTKYFFIINFPVYFNINTFQKCLKYVLNKDIDVIYYKIYDIKRTKPIKNKFKVEEQSSLHTINDLLIKKDIDDNILHYIFATRLTKDLKIYFDTEVTLYNEFSYILKVLYYSKTISYSQDSFVTLDDYRYIKKRPGKGFLTRYKMDILYVFKLMLHDKPDFNLYKKIFLHPKLYANIFFNDTLNDFSLKHIPDIFFIILYYFKKIYLLSSNNYVYYGGSYTKLIQNNNLMQDFDNSRNRDVKYCLIVQNDFCLNKDANKTFFKNLLNQKNKQFECYILHKDNEIVQLDSEIAPFIKTYNNVFKIITYHDLKRTIGLILEQTMASYISIMSINDIPYINYFDVIEKNLLKNNNPSLLSFAYHEYNYDISINRRIRFNNSSEIGFIIKRKFQKENDTELFTKVIQKDLLRKYIDSVDINLTNKDYSGNFFFTLKLFAAATKCVTIKKSIINHQYQTKLIYNYTEFLSFVNNAVNLKLFFESEKLDKSYLVSLFNSSRFRKILSSRIQRLNPPEYLKRKIYLNTIKLILSKKDENHIITDVDEIIYLEEK